MGSAVAEPRDGDAAEAPAATRSGHGRIRLVAVVAVTVVVLDQLTKQWALSALADGPVDVVGPVFFSLTWNTGASFSMGQGRNIGPLVGLLAIGIVVWLLRSGHGHTVVGAVAAGLVAGGALGNLVDRAFRTGPDGAPAGFLGGAVVDFVASDVWPTFNVADSAVVVGAILLVIVSLFVPEDA